MPTLTLHHYKNQKMPYVAKIVTDGSGGTTQSFLEKVLVKKSDDGTYGDYKCTVDQEGFYRIGNTKPDDGGYRLFYKSPAGGNKFPFVTPAQAEDIKGRIACGESIAQIASALGFK